jgi:hypothetical protein
MEDDMSRRIVIAALMIAILALGACTPKEISTLSAALSELTGKVDLKEADTEVFVPASVDSTLGVNGQIQTGDDGRVRLDLSTGTIIRVAPSSMFTLTANDEVQGGLATRIKLELGKIFIILNGGTAEVETPSGVASVRGSYMKVDVDPETGDVHVTCLEGDCSAGNPAGTVSFTKGEKTILFHQNDDGSWTMPDVNPMTPEEFQEWLDNNPEAQQLFNEAMAALTAFAAVPTATEVPTATPEPTIESALPAGGSSSACKTIQPTGGSSLPHQGKVKFEWEGQANAQKYVVTFTNGTTMVTFETTDTSMEKYIEILPAGGEYSWDVTAYGEDGGQLCKSETVSFSKPDSKWVPEKIKEPEEESCNPMDCSGSCPNPYYCGQ